MSEKKNNIEYRKITMEVRPFTFEETKTERFMKKYGSGVRDIIFTPLSILCGVLSFIFRLIGTVSSVLMIAGFYYGYKTYTVVQGGYNLMHGGYFKLAVVFLISPFIALTVSVIFNWLRDYFSVQ